MDSSVVNETTRVLIAVNSNNTEHKYGENPLKISVTTDRNYQCYVLNTLLLLPEVEELVLHYVLDRNSKLI